MGSLRQEINDIYEEYVIDQEPVNGIAKIPAKELSWLARQALYLQERLDECETGEEPPLPPDTVQPPTRSELSQRITDVNRRLGLVSDKMEKRVTVLTDAVNAERIARLKIERQMQPLNLMFPGLVPPCGQPGKDFAAKFPNDKE